jgi:hypothetical protein
MEWTLAPSLKVLRGQVNETYPNRDKTSDGTIGDAAHAQTRSDHNPNSQGVVCALDLDHDPDNGFDGDKFLEAQLQNPHPDLKYIVWEGHIYSRKYGFVKRSSSGHFAHLHVSVGVGTDGQSQPGTYNNTTLWNIGNTGGQPMSGITKDQIDYINLLAYGSKPGAGYDYRHVGGSLHDFLVGVFGPDPLKNPNTLVAKVNEGKLVPVVESFDKEKLYTDQIAATKKVFGK